MTPGGFHFGDFTFDPSERLLSRGAERLDLNGRYLDALALLLRERGRLVTKDRFMDEVWRGVPVTDEALTQCIKTLRKQLGDDAASPRFIETVPKHGYRFIARVEAADMPEDTPWRRFFLLGGAGTIGAGIAGMIGGLLYGFAGASQPLVPGMGAASVLIVLLCLTVAMALTGGAGVAFGIAAACVASPRSWVPVVGGACGGLIVGAIVKLLGLDAFNLLFGQSPGDITGAGEGVILGGAVGLGTWLGTRGAEAGSLRRAIVLAGLAGAAAGVLIPLLGGRMMGGSLDLLARHFPNSRLRLDQIGGLFGEQDFGPVSQVVTSGLEGALFGSCIVGAMLIARRDMARS